MFRDVLASDLRRLSRCPDFALAVDDARERPPAVPSSHAQGEVGSIPPPDFRRRLGESAVEVAVVAHDLARLVARLVPARAGRQPES